MNSFLVTAAQEILKDSSLPLEEKIIILPNKRAGIFLSKALVDLAKKPLLSPEIITIQDFITQYSPWEQIEWLDLVFEFYQAYKEYYISIGKTDLIKNFDEFIKWAPIALNDFEELDRFLLDPKKVFNYISEAKVLEKWNLENSESKFITEFKDYFSSLYGLYESLKKKLIDHKHVYNGLNYRYLSENIVTLGEKFKKRQLFFIGFNALTKAEENIIQTLINKGKAQIFWDADNYYLQNGFEAGKFLRQHKKKFHSFPWLFDNYKEDKKINIIEASGQIAQMNVLSEVLKTETKDYEKTAVVLNENALLFPLLNSLPKEIPSLNVSLGIPLTDIPLVQIFIQINQLFLDLEFYGKYKTEHVIELIQSPFLEEELKEFTQEQKSKIINYILKYSAKLLDKDFMKEVAEEMNGIIADVFKTDFSISKILPFYLKLIENLSLKNLDQTTKIGLQKLEEVILSIQNFQDYSQTITSYKTLDLIFKRLLSKEQIYFEGEPLEGLQILGLLETRLLDFDHIIMTSVNEGVLPKGKNEQSIIPFDIKLELGLPTHRDQTAIMAYYFYRILQRAKKITLIYNSSESGLNSGELSRFAHQIKNELPHYNSNTEIKTQSYRPQTQIIDREISIKKTPYIMERLWDKASKENGFGPTTLGSYIYDPISFLKNKILKLEEEEEIIDGIPSRIMGNIIHNTLEKLYTPYINKSLNLKDLSQLNKQYKKIASEELNKALSYKGQLYGKKHIAYEVILKNIADIINIDKQLLSKGNTLEIMFLEEKFKHAVKVEGKEIFIIGLVDRIDKLNGKLRIIDYKTGKVDEDKLVIKDKEFDRNFDFLLEDHKHSKIFQLLTYGWMYYKSNPKKFNSFSAGIISSRKYRHGLHEVKINNEAQIPFELMKDFEQILIRLLEEIFDPNQNFTQKKTV